jgi:hypothetical protein
MHFRGDAAGADSFLPMAATCMNILKLPAYSDIGAWQFFNVARGFTFLYFRVLVSTSKSRLHSNSRAAETMRGKLIYAMNSNSGFFLA